MDEERRAGRSHTAAEEDRGRPRRGPLRRGMLRLGPVQLHWLQVVVHTGVALSLGWLARQSMGGAFVVDPVREVQTYTGKAALVLLVLSLACTPLRTLTGWQPLLRARRPLGVYSFCYAALHFANYLALDYGFDLELLLQGIAEEWYVIAGLAAGLLLLPLALTSSRGWKRRLRKNWKRLHRLVYVAGVLAVVHFLWLVKDPQEPLRYATILGLLLALRLPPLRRAASRLRRALANSRSSGVSGKASTSVD
jgi:methionine sulfoxide reductase heme-binding subunit